MANTYTIKSGDTLSKIASQYGTTVGALAKANNISDVNKITAGQALNLGTVSSGSSSIPSISTPVVSSYDANQYRNNLSTLTQTSTPSYVPPKTNITYPTVIPSQGLATNPNAVLTPPANNGQGNTTPTPQVKAPVTPTATTTPPVQQPTAPNANPIATPSAGGAYMVKAGDNLSTIASRNGMTLEQLRALNPAITDPNRIAVGQSINLGGGTPAQTTNPTGGNMNPNGTPTTPVQTAQQTNDELARKAGEAGLSIDEYSKLVAPTKEETDKIAKELGITALEGQAFKKPSQSSQQLYDTAYSTSGLAELKSKITTLNDSINKDRSDLADAIGAVDENPFLTETSRVGRGKRITDQAEAKINNKLAQVKQIQDLYDAGINEINNMVTRNTNDFGKNQEIDQAQLNYLIAKAEKEATQLGTSKSTASMGAYLTAKSASAKPDVIGNSDTGFFRWDGTLKKFVQVIAPSAKAGLDIENQKLQNQKLRNDINNPDSGASSFKPTADQKALVKRATFASMKDTDGTPITFTPVDRAKLDTDSNFFYWVLQKANENGIY